MSGGRIFFVGIKLDISVLFDKIIKELQFAKGKYFELCNLYIKELITLCSRYVIESTSPTIKQNKIVEDAIEYFNDNFNLIINIKDYANYQNISCCWFIRSFKSYTGTTPTQYITNIRINKAKNLLLGNSLTIGEIGDLIGYQNPLYFSRIFKKMLRLLLVVIETNNPHYFVASISSIKSFHSGCSAYVGLAASWNLAC